MSHEFVRDTQVVENNPFKRYVSWAAVLSGITGMAGVVLLVLFFLFELERAINESWRGDYFFGNLNDIANIFQALLLAVVMVGLNRLFANQYSGLRHVVMVVGIVGSVLLAVTQTLFVLKVISAEQQTPLFVSSWGVVGLWLSLVNMVGRLPTFIRRFGTVVGLSLVFQMVVFFLLGGLEVANDLDSIRANTPLLIGMGLGLAIGLAGLPIWTIAIGYFLRERDE